MQLEVALSRRFGGHDGRATEWEIRTVNVYSLDNFIQREVRRVFETMPTLPGIYIHRDIFFIALPQGTTYVEAGKVAAAFAALDERALVGALEGIAHNL